MCLYFKLFAVMTTLALGGCALVPDDHAQRENAASQSSLEAQHLSPNSDPADRSHIAQARREMEISSAKAPARASLELPKYLSAEYLKREKQTEDRLKRVMTSAKVARDVQTTFPFLGYQRRRPASALCLLYLQQQKFAALADALIFVHRQVPFA